MTLSAVLLGLAALCVAVALVAAVRIAIVLDRAGTSTPLPLLGALVFRNLARHRERTLRESGSVGPLYYAYVVPINAAWILALLAWFAG